MQNLENLDVIEIFITRKLLKSLKDPMSDRRPNVIIKWIYGFKKMFFFKFQHFALLETVR